MGPPPLSLISSLFYVKLKFLIPESRLCQIQCPQAPLQPSIELVLCIPECTTSLSFVFDVVLLEHRCP